MFCCKMNMLTQIVRNFEPFVKRRYGVQLCEIQLLCIIPFEYISVGFEGVIFVISRKENRSFLYQHKTNSDVYSIQQLPKHTLISTQ